MKKVTILLTNEIMKGNPIFLELGFSAGTTVTITHSKGKEGEASTTIVGGRPDDRNPKP